MKLTPETISPLFNCNAPNQRQCAMLGIKLRTGWMDKLIGREIGDDLYASVLAVKGRKPKGMTKREWRNPNAPNGLQTQNRAILLTEAEISHLLDLLDMSETSGEHLGDRDAYWSTSSALIAKLTAYHTPTLPIPFA